MNWKFWKKKEAEPVEEETTSENGLGLTFVVEDNDVYAVCDWPKLESYTKEQIEAFIQKYTLFIWLLNNGELLTTIQKAISKYGEYTGYNGIATRIMNNLNTLIAARGMNDSDVVVPPTKAFNVRHN